MICTSPTCGALSVHRTRAAATRAGPEGRTVAYVPLGERRDGASIQLPGIDTLAVPMAEPLSTATRGAGAAQV